MSTHQVTITGAQPALGPVPDAPRRPIQELIKDEKQWSLYVQAHIRMMAKDQKDVVSWFQIEGIHGLPYIVWDGANDTIYPGAGYCTHGSNLFPTWHRIYVSLFEQVLQSNAIQIAQEYEKSEQGWLEAAHALRSPYWDWASNTPPPDEIIRFKTIEIASPKGTQTVTNPLYAYKFHPIDPSFQPPFSGDTYTVRNPDPNSPPPQESRPDALLASLKQFDARTAIYMTMTLVKDWFHFSNHNSDAGGNNEPVANSLESSHDNIHTLVGGAGHMAEVPYAAFDPIFWLHHTEVDRLLALWQSINPTVWVAPEQATAQEAPGVDVKTKLTPFWSGADSFWTSSDGPVRAFTALNYTYPEFAGLNLNNPGEVKTAILRIVKDLYGPPQKKGPFAGKEREHWYIRVRAGRFALGTSYTILLFIGAVPDQQSEWREAPTLVGFHSIFSSRHQQQCGNCVAQNDAVNEGVVHIDDKLEELGLTGKSDDEIEAYLKEELHWRIQKMDGTVVQPEDVADLDIAAMSVGLHWSEVHEIYEVPHHGKPRHHKDVTHGRPGGHTVA